MDYDKTNNNGFLGNETFESSYNAHDLVAGDGPGLDAMAVEPQVPVHLDRLEQPRARVASRRATGSRAASISASIPPAVGPSVPRAAAAAARRGGGGEGHPGHEPLRQSRAQGPSATYEDLMDNVSPVTRHISNFELEIVLNDLTVEKWTPRHQGGGARPSDYVDARVPARAPSRISSVPACSVSVSTSPTRPSS